MILFNGQNGGLGRYFKAACDQEHLTARLIKSRLEDTDGLRRELDSLEGLSDPSLKALTWVQMAAMVPVALCAENPDKARQVNVVNTLATLRTFSQWAAARQLRARIFYVSTCHVYAPVAPGHRLTEKDAVAPRSVYAQSKLEAENNLGVLAKEMQVPLLIGRVFGLISVQQPPTYVLPNLIRRVQQKDVTPVPGLRYIRDYLDSRDVCRSIAKLCGRDWSAFFKSPAGVVNICAGEPVSIRDLLEHVLRAQDPKNLALLKDWSEAPGRPDDNPWLVGDPSRLVEWIGGPARTIPLGQTVEEAFEESVRSKSPAAPAKSR